MDDNSLIDQAAIRNEIASQSTSDATLAVDITEEAKSLEIGRALELENLDRTKKDNIARRRFSQIIFWVTVIWMGLILVIIILSGLKLLSLSDGVLIALITTTTANVFGFLYVVVNYLFNKEKST